MSTINMLSYDNLTLPLKWHGGKGGHTNYLAKQFISLMPEDHIHYVEPYFGGGAVLFAKNPEGYSELINDINGALTNFWQVMRDENQFRQFHRWVECTPFSEVEWKNAVEPTDDPILAAYRFFLRCRLSLAGRMKGFSGITRTRTRSKMNGEVSAWLGCIDGLAAVHARLKRVVIMNRPALDIIAGHDTPKTCFYLDPPYVHSTRQTTGEYEYEMTDAQHQELLDLLATVKGRFLLSGYQCEMYLAAAEKYGWRRVDFDIANHASSAKTKTRQIESVWMNY